MLNRWFDVDKEGLAKLIEEFGHGRLIAELFQNCLDEPVSEITGTLTRIGRNTYKLVVEDNSPEGFKNLDHAWTLFAESYKKGVPDKRGRFNLGEKLVLAMCDSAKIESTSGTVEFLENGERQISRRKTREVGTVFTAELRMTLEQFDAATKFVQTLLIPDDVTATFNGQRIESRSPIRTFMEELDTVLAPLDSDGVPRKTRRKTWIELYETRNGEVPHIYEMGIPVVDVEEVGLRWHINVKQKIPLNFNRDNVTPAYLRRLLTLTLNTIHNQLTAEDAAQPWVTQATSDDEVTSEAMGTFLDLHVGEKRASYDPTDPEANMNFVSQGGTVLHGRQLSKEQWENSRRHGLIQRSGVFCPSPRPYSDDPDAPTVKVLPEGEYTEGMKNIVALVKYLGWQLLDCGVRVQIVYAPNFAACYGPGRFDFSLQRLGRSWFDQGLTASVADLIIHEFGHHYSLNHLSEEYHDALTRIGGKFVMLAMKKGNEGNRLKEFVK